MISTASLPIRVAYNFIQPKNWTWNGITNGSGCYSFKGVAGVSYVVTMFYVWPNIGDVSTGVDVIAGRSQTVNLDRVCC